MAEKPVVRDPTHAGSWYTSKGSELDKQLSGWLGAVRPPVNCIVPQSQGEHLEQLPVPGARVIIGPYVMFESCEKFGPGVDTIVGTLVTHIQVPQQRGHTRLGTLARRKYAILVVSSITSLFHIHQSDSSMPPLVGKLHEHMYLSLTICFPQQASISPWTFTSLLHITSLSVKVQPLWHTPWQSDGR